NRLFPKRQIKRVLFVSPPDADSSLFNWATGKRGRYLNYPPYGPGVLATHLRALGIEVQLVSLQTAVLRACHQAESADDFDFDKAWQEALHHKLLEAPPDLVGITCMFSQTHTSMVTVCKYLREHMPLTPLAVGGVHITNCFASPNTREMLLRDLEMVDL